MPNNVLDAHSSHAESTQRRFSINYSIIARQFNIFTNTTTYIYKRTFPLPCAIKEGNNSNTRFQLATQRRYEVFLAVNESIVDRNRALLNYSKSAINLQSNL
jgi:hypothetical protein